MVDFGAFVDCGLEEDGLLHRSAWRRRLVHGGRGGGGGGDSWPPAEIAVGGATGVCILGALHLG
eukprot:COSAG01_NODE_9789_length_2343_cov_3.490642_4_plen_64_part_00